MIDVQNDPNVLAVKLALLRAMPELTGQQISDAAIHAVCAIRERTKSPSTGPQDEVYRGPG